MDVALLTALVKILAPCLPFLQGLSTKAIEKGSEKLGEKGAEGLVQLPLAQKLWNKLLPKIEAKEAAKEAAEDVAKNPEDEDAIAALRNQLRKILEAPGSEVLVSEVTQILAEEQSLTDSHKYIVKVQDSVVGAIGDRNTVTQHINSNLRG